jgi:hypothetical protein
MATERDEVLKKMTPYLRAHLVGKMYKRSAAAGMTQHSYAAMLLDNIALDDFRSENQKTLNQQCIPQQKPERKRRGPRRFSRSEREEVKKMICSGGIRPDSPAALLVAEEELDARVDY